MRLPLPAFLFVIPALAWAQKTIVPKLDEEGRRGEIARIAAEKARKRFAELDQDRDDRLSREEVASHGYLADQFERLDRNRDGFLDWNEFVGHDRWPRRAD